MRWDNRVNDLASAPAADTYLRYRAETAYKNFGQFIAGRDYNDVYSSAFEEGEGFADVSFNKTTSTKTLATPSPYLPLAGDAQLHVVVVATGNDIHRSILEVNGNTLEDNTFGGFGVQRYTTGIPGLSTSTSITIDAAGTGASDRQRFSLVRADYARESTLASMTRASFRVNENPASSRLLGIKGFTTSSVDPILYDQDNGVRMMGSRVADSVYFHLDYDATNAACYLHSSSSSIIRSVIRIVPVSFTNLSNPTNQGDYMLVYHPSLRNSSGGSDYVEAYRGYRASMAGGDWDAISLDVGELYDQFSYGVRRHPLAFRGLARYATEQFAEPAKHLFLVGHGRRYNEFRSNNTETKATLIPTYGFPGSDLLLGAERGTTAPVLAIGRLAATNGDQVGTYLGKIQLVEAAQQTGVQTVANKHWMKNILHFGGGITTFEQATFRNYLAEYERSIEDTVYGGWVNGFFKTTSDAIVEPTGQRIDSFLQAGVSLMTFFGHSSFDVFDFNIGDPDDFPLDNKFPVLFSNGCVTGEIHTSRYSLSEQYVFSDAGSVAFIAASTFSFANGLHAYARILYGKLTGSAYGEGIGEAIRVAAVQLEGSVSVTTRLAIEHTTLHGDPAISLNTHSKPDYAIETPYVTFSPEVLTVAADSFDLVLQVFNLGKAPDTAMFVSVRRTLPDGSSDERLRRVQATRHRDTLFFRFPTEAIAGVGLNAFDIRVDAQGEIEELDEMNNILSLNVTVASDDAIPTWPYDYAIVGEPVDMLKASTADPFAPLRRYVLQIDTTEKYNSPLLTETHVEQSGGVVAWENPGIPWLDSAVYYWRISLDTLYDNPLRWRQHSLVYLPERGPGWNQSHFYQFAKDDYTSMSLDNDRVFRFADNIRVLDFETGGAWFQIISYLDFAQQAFYSCAAEGFVVFVFNPNNGQQWYTDDINGDGICRYGGVSCSGNPTDGYIQYKTGDANQREALFRLLMDTIPEGFYVGMYTTLYEPNFPFLATEKYAWGTDSLTLLDALSFYGATAVDSFADISYRPPYCFFGRKGFPAAAEEVVGTFATERITARFEIPGFWREGFFKTPAIGPANAWNSLQWRSESADALLVDDESVRLIGISPSGVESVLANGIQAADTSLAWIDPVLWPRIRLQLDARDDSLRTPTQLQHWRVLYDPVPEAALNPNGFLVRGPDSLYQGEDYAMEVAIDNISDWSMDSLLVEFAVVDANNVRYPLPYERQDSLRTGDRQIARIAFNTLDYPGGTNFVSIDVNPAFDQPEQFRVNNLGLIPFHLLSDRQNPFLDVTFDGTRILDGDLVSAEPDILIRLTDENPILALADTSVLRVSLVYPDGLEKVIGFDDPILQFTPADPAALEGGNRAEILLLPDLEIDGTYTLVVAGRDASGNNAGEIEYRVSFEVINEAMISNMLTYPNPFTTQTQFVFTLTGSEVPEDLRIQIMTVSGKIIREIDRAELGNLRIGLNRTDFRWDGTDRYGDPVGNGLYFYRVMARLNGEAMEHFATGADRWFKSGFGKMYMAR